MAKAGSGPGLVDCDVHPNIKSIKDLYPYLPRRWVDYIEETGFSQIPQNPYPKGANRGVRLDAVPAGGVAGSDLGLMRTQLLDQYDVEFAILNPEHSYRLNFLPNADFAAALASAFNDWLIYEWLEKDQRLLGSAVVATQDPEQAVKEVRRVGKHPRIVQILLPAGAQRPYGQRHYWPIYAAAEELGLAIGIHFGGTGVSTGHPPTPVGWPSYYIEWHTLMPQAFQAHLVSFICEGVFERFKGLKVTLIEGGFSWLLHLIWRLDKNFRSLRSEVPWLKRFPSEYVPEHFRFTTQPMEEPENEADLLEVMRIMGAEGLLMFASDYPHWDFDDPVYALPRGLSEGARARILRENALAWYGLNGQVSGLPGR
jgi:predicted TIM-barrel fold metal-dependent hydrolase